VPVADARLTPRQERLLRALMAGLTNREIAGRLGLQEQTVKNQLSVLYGKLGVRSRLQLAVRARRHVRSEGLMDK
jgi:DNA-binding NarL/FixJ family response regulator